MVPMYQTIKEIRGEYNFENGLELENEQFFDAFNNPSTKRNPSPVSRDCYISAERSFINKVGTEIGNEEFGNPIDYFRAASLVKLNDGNIRVVFDMIDHQSEDIYYLPQLKTLQTQLEG